MEIKIVAVFNHRYLQFKTKINEADRLVLMIKLNDRYFCLSRGCSLMTNIKIKQFFKYMRKKMNVM